MLAKRGETGNGGSRYAGTARPPASAGTMFSYGFGAAAYGITDSGFGTFLLLFYNQVLGLNAATVGLVIMAALVIDALIDPAVGALSGIFVAGMILSLSHFPEAAQPGQVPGATIDRLVAIFGAVYLVLGATADLLFSRFPFGRAEHQARLADLTGARSLTSPRDPP